MVFGDRLCPAESTEPAEWLVETEHTPGWTIGSLLPAHYEAYLAVAAPGEEADDWWGAHQQTMERASVVLAGHTATPETSWFAVWDGHGFDSWARRIAWGADDATSARQRREQQAAIEREDARLIADIRAALAEVPSFALPGRTYYLLSGHLSDVASLRFPHDPETWHGPDLWWPEDRQWFVGTDVDFWTTFVGGTRTLIEELHARLPDLSRVVGVDDDLPDPE